MVVNNNILSMNANRNLNIVTQSTQKSTEKLSSGYRINRAADDAAGLTISEKMRSMIRGLNQGSRNTQDGISWIHVADGAMTEIHDMLHRMKELSVKAANGTNTDADRNAIDSEYNQLIKEIDKIDRSTEFNSKKVFLNANVQLSVSGDPGDLEVFDATYDSNNRLVEYGGFKFHGERITWDKIDSNMVSTVNGKQVFNKGVYKFSNSSVDSAYHFEVEADGTTEVPIITRNVDLRANNEGISIDGYKISWNTIGINSNPVQPGSYYAKYGNSVLEICVGDKQENTTLDDVIQYINTRNDGVFEYKWTTACIGVAGEKAVNMYSANDPKGKYNRTEVVDSQMAMNTNCNTKNVADPESKLEYTIIINKNGSDDPNQQTIYLEGSVGGKIAGSEKTLASLGITSWDSGLSIKEGKEYVYKDTSGTKVEFKFTLSDITSFDSVEDGLYRVKLGGAYNTSYDNKVVSDNSNVVIKGQSDFYDVTTFNQEVELGRDFDRTSYEVQKDLFSYDSTSETMGFSIDSVIPGKSDLYTVSLSTSAAQSKIENTITAEVNDMYRWKLEQAIENKSTHKIYDDPNLKTDLIIGNGANWIEYEYDCNEYLNALDKALNVEMYKVPENTESVPITDLNDYYVQDATGKYVDVKSYMEKLADDAIRLLMNPKWEGGKVGISTTTLSQFNNWQNGSIEVMGGKVKVAPGANVIDSVNKMLAKSEKYDSEDELYEALKNVLVPGGDYSNFIITDKVDLYKVKVSFDESKVSFGNVSLNSSTEYIAGRLQTYQPYKSNLKNIDDIKNSIDNYSVYVMNQIENASSYSVYKDGTETTATFSGDEHSNTAIRAYYDSAIDLIPIEKGIDIQHSGIAGDYTTIPQFSINSSVLGIKSLSLKSELHAKYAIDKVDSAIAYVSEKRSKLGAVQNRLEHTLNNNENKAENLTDAESRIRDTDMSKEMVTFTKNNILKQAGISILSSANQNAQNVLSLLQ